MPKIDMNITNGSSKSCSIKDCKQPSKCKSYCFKHYSRFLATGDPLKTPTGREHGKRNLCTLGDGKVVEGYGFCRLHYKRQKKYGDPNITNRSLSYGNYRYNKEGYVIVRPPKGWRGARRDGYMLEHRFVMEKHLGRTLQKHEVVHHKNGIRDDNRIANLELLTVSIHSMGHLLNVCPNCGHSIEKPKRREKDH